MRPHIAVTLLVVSLGLVACDGEGEEVDTAEVTMVDTPAASMPGGAMPGMGPGAMGPGGMGPRMMMGEWEQHMASMRGISDDSLLAMRGQHRQMATRMMASMDSMHMRMGMTADSSWMALRDSLQQDLGRMEGMTAEQLRAFIDEHHARMLRMMQMNQSMTGAAPR